MDKKLLRDDRIKKAKKILCQMFKVDVFNLENNISRKRNIIDARRFFIYYLRNEIIMPYDRIKEYIKGLHHATAIYQCKKFRDLLQYEKPLRNKYHKFIVMANDFDVLTTLLSIKRTQAKYINRELRELNNLFKQKRCEEDVKIIKNQYKL